MRLGAGLTDESLDALMRAIIDERMEVVARNASIVALEIGVGKSESRYPLLTSSVAFAF